MSKYGHEPSPVCVYSGACFAMRDGRCSILTSIPKNTCHFQKPEREMTNGKRYLKRV